MKMVKNMMCVILAIMLIGCTNGKTNEDDIATNDSSIYYFTYTEQKFIFYDNIERFENIRMLFDQSGYRKLFVEQELSGGRYIWTIPGEGEVDKSIIDPTLVQAMDDFCEITKFRSIKYHALDSVTGYRFEISFWDEYGNDGFAYLVDGPEKEAAKFYEELSGHWYHFALPAV